MKTIKQIAEEVGVSKTAVRKKIENLGLSEKLQTIGNRIVLDDKQERLIKSAFSQSETEAKSETKNQKSVSEKTESFQLVSDLVKVLQEQLSEKDRQLAEKDRQIAELNERLVESLKLVDHEQQLRMVTEQKMLVLEQGQEQEESVVEKRWWQFWK